MKKIIWAAAILLAFLIPVVAVSAASATHADHDDHPNINGMGTISFAQGATISAPTDHDHDDHTAIVTVKETLTFTGNLTGTALTIQRDATHNATDEGVKITFTTFHGSGNFTGTLNGNQVTLRIRYEGVKNSTFARGNFVVNGDNTQMNDVHGQGHFNGTLTGGVEGSGGSTVPYTMHSTVSTHTDHDTEARDKDEVREAEAE
jgi:hypothetical protein